MPDSSPSFERIDEKSLLRQLLHSTPDHVYFKDREGRFLLINQSQSNIFGLDSPEDAVGKSDFDFFSAEHARQALDDEKHIMATGKPLVGIVEKETWPDGRITWASTTKEPLRDARGGIIGTFGISRDVTKRHEAEQKVAAFTEELKQVNKQTHADISIAGEMQEALLPRIYPLFPNQCLPSESAIRFAHVYQPAGTVGGDMLCIEKLSESKVGVFICDAIGHGVRAALLSAMVFALFHELSHRHETPGPFLRALNDRMRNLMCDCPDVVFATACYIIIDIENHVVTCANAGHPSPMLVSPSHNNSVFLHPDSSQLGPALALVDQAFYPESRHDYPPGSRILMVTDGILDAGPKPGIEFGEERLAMLMDHQRDSSPDVLLSELLNSLKSFTGHGKLQDDLCAVCMAL